MNLSGIVVLADPAYVDAVCGVLAALDGVEIHAVDRDRGRIVLVQEAIDIDAEVAGFMRIRTVPHVLTADLVCHYFGDEPVASPNLDSPLAALAAPAPAAPPS